MGLAARGGPLALVRKALPIIEREREREGALVRRIGVSRACVRQRCGPPSNARACPPFVFSCLAGGCARRKFIPRPHRVVKCRKAPPTYVYAGHWKLHVGKCQSDEFFASLLWGAHHHHHHRRNASPALRPYNRVLDWNFRKIHISSDRWR